MKHIYTLLLLIISLPSYSENLDSKVETIENHIENIINCGDFRNFYSEKIYGDQYNISKVNLL
ncbi:hypothetical protein LEP1GSC124_4914 [Leptospira interrogans serovar Pyrogenes str. 200701872]|uniref:Uncharacterized protein n=1 Tax=Leptospira interrogans serovar Pyrogenes str. 200701872 TaxID=1193029 RepID=M6ZLJ5_LEPIR|nr:hypothetical protein LEP1GSC124_4914 [Leptospira interrogans serovar Pyrogenes str. 200701872]